MFVKVVEFGLLSGLKLLDLMKLLLSLCYQLIKNDENSDDFST